MARPASAFLLLFAALLPASGCRREPVGSSPRPPDILFVLVDDLSTDIDLYGGGARTPALDRLAAQGRRFDHTYCQYPLCNPSRASIFSGWRPERTRVWGNLRDPAPWLREAVLLQDHFARNGYYTARVGKAYHSRFENEFHWSEVVETYGGPATGEEAVAVEWGAWSGDESAMPDALGARNALRILTAPRSQPVFLVFGLLKPHAPWVVPERYLRLYPPQETNLPASATAVPPSIVRSARRTPIPREQWSAALGAYRAAVTFADAQIGAVLEGLQRAGTLDRTVVVVTSDNGLHVADHGIFGKSTLLEPALRVPLVIAAPGIARPGVPTAALVELVDLYPTLVDLCGLPPVAGLDGVSLRRLLEDPQGSVKEAAFSMLKIGAARAGQAGRSVRDQRYRFTLWPDGSEELFDLLADPDELANLASSPAEDRVRLALRRRLDTLPPVVAAQAEGALALPTHR